ncbi:MAG: FAD binding domain-containing protein [Actinomycetota bacterium]
MVPFGYVRPSCVAEAIAASGPERRYLAGGQSLLAALKLRLAAPETLVDIGRLPELQGIAVVDGALEVGAGCTHAEIAEGAAAIPALAALAGSIGDVQVRNMGTLGGALANNDPAGDHAAAVLGLGADIRTDRRTIAADDFFTGMFETALEPGELVVRVAYPLPRRAAYAKVRNPASGYPVVGVFVADTAAGPRVAVTGAAVCPFRLAAFEQALADRFDPGALAGLAVDGRDFNRDLHASAEYRAHLVGVLAARAVAAMV